MDESMKKKFAEITKIIRDDHRKLCEINFTNNFYENRIREVEKEVETIKKNIKKKNKYLEEFLIPNYKLLHSTRMGLEAKQRVLLDAVKNQDHLNYLLIKNRERVEAENKKLALECKKDLQERKEKFIANNKPLFERYEQVKNKLKLAKIEEHMALVQLAKEKHKVALKKLIQQKQYYAFFVNLAEQGLMGIKMRKMDELNKLKQVQFKLMQKLQDAKTKKREQREIATFSLCSPSSVMVINDTENHLNDDVESPNLPKELNTAVNIIENKLLLEVPTTPILNPAMDIISMRKRKRIEDLKLQGNSKSVDHSSSVVEGEKLKSVPFQVNTQPEEKERKILNGNELVEKVPEIENRPISTVGQNKRFKPMQLQQNEEYEEVEKKREFSKRGESMRKVIETEKLKLGKFQLNEEQNVKKNKQEFSKKRELFKKSIEIEAPSSDVIEKENKFKIVEVQQRTDQQEAEKKQGSLRREESFQKLENSNTARSFFQNILPAQQTPDIYLNEPNNEENNVLEEMDSSILNMSNLNNSWDEAGMDFLEDEQNNIPKSFSLFNLPSTSFHGGTETGTKSGFSFGSKDMNPFGFL